MITRSKIERTILLIILIMYCLMVKNYFSSLIYLIIILVGSIYFFPIKVILNRKHPNLSLMIVSSFLISVSLVLSHLSYVMNQLSENFKFILFFLMIINLFLVYKFTQIDNNNKYLHLILLFLLIVTLYK